MDGLIKALYNAGFTVWNTIVGLAMTLFTKSPASLDVYNIAHNIYLSIQDITIPIAIVIFLIGWLKAVCQGPPERTAHEMFGIFLRFCIVVAIAANLWAFMGYVIQVTDGITDAVASSSGGIPDYNLDLKDTLSSAIDSISSTPTSDDIDWDIMHPFISFGKFVTIWVTWFLTYVGFLIASIITLGIMVYCSIVILSQAYQRIIKPLVVLPFMAISFGFAAGQGEGDRVAINYFKTIVGYLLSGAFMVVAVKIGVALTNSDDITNALVSSSSDVTMVMLLESIKTMITPIITVGIVKSTDSIMSRLF